MATTRKRKPLKKKKTAKKRPAKQSHLRQSKSSDFLEKIREHNPMVEYFSRLTVMNPPAEASTESSAQKRDGGYVRLAHAREEFSAPVITKGKGAERRKKENQ